MNIEVLLYQIVALPNKMFWDGLQLHYIACLAAAEEEIYVKWLSIVCTQDEIGRMEPGWPSLYLKLSLNTLLIVVFIPSNIPGRCVSNIS